MFSLALLYQHILLLFFSDISSLLFCISSKSFSLFSVCHSLMQDWLSDTVCVCAFLTGVCQAAEVNSTVSVSTADVPQQVSNSEFQTVTVTAARVQNITLLPEPPRRTSVPSKPQQILKGTYISLSLYTSLSSLLDLLYSRSLHFQITCLLI